MSSARAAFSRNRAGEQRARGHPLDQQVVEILGRDRDQLQRRRLVGVGQPQGDAVVRPHRLHLDAGGGAHPRLDGHRPGRVHAAAERREDADPPVADLVAEPLDDDRPVVRQDARRLALVVQVRGQVAGGQLVQVAEAPLAHGLADRDAQLERAADAIALPERHLAGHAGRGRDQHAVAGDLLDPPRGRAQLEHLALPGLVHHLLVELADPRAGVGQEHAVQPAVGDGASRDDGQAAGAVAGAHGAGDPVPDDPRPQLGELVRRVAAGQHLQHALELGARQLAVGIRPAHQVVERVDRPLVHRQRRHHLLGQHVQRLLGHPRVLDLALAHPADDHGRLQQVAPPLGEEAADRRLADAVAGAADALQAGGHGLRRLDLDDQVDGAHVDAELQRRCRDQRRQLPRLQQLLHLEPLLAGDRAVVRAGDRRLGELVQPVGDPLGRAAVVDEHDRRAVRLHQLQQPRVDGGPDRLAGLAFDRRRGAQLAHVLDRDHHLQVERLAVPGVDDRHRPVAAQEPGDLLQRALRCRQPDPLRLGRRDRRQPLQREHQVRTALGAGDGVDLVDDHRLDRAQHLAGAGGQHQVQRLGRGDQDVRRVAADRRALGLRRIAASQRDRHRRIGADAGQRRAQVALNIVVQRAQRGDVEHAGAPALAVGAQPVERPQERGQRLARPGGCQDQRVVARRDRRPALRLGRSRLGEGAPEPSGDAIGERCEGVARHTCNLARAYARREDALLRTRRVRRKKASA